MGNVQKKPKTDRPVEAMLELVPGEAGEVLLRRADSDDEPLVTIRFSKLVQEVLGDQVFGVSQGMIHAALMQLMEQQAAKWHAQVLDEEPPRYS